MVNEILKKDLSNSKGKKVVIYKLNGFRYECNVIYVDEEFVKVWDLKKEKFLYINIKEISEVDIE